MLGVRERIDGRDAAEFREILDIALRESSDDDAVQHPSHHARGILDRFPRPSWISPPARNMTVPPNSRIPTSNETRVRVEDFENIKAQHLSRSGCAACEPRFALTAWLRKTMR